MRSFKAHQDHYQAQHRTTGCKIAHMIGVPMIAVSIPLLVLNWRFALALLAVGWIFQLIGHYIFEKNHPVFMADPKNPFTYCSALVFVFNEWLSLLGRLNRKQHKVKEKNP